DTLYVVSAIGYVLLALQQPPRSPLFPYTTLFRSQQPLDDLFVGVRRRIGNERGDLGFARRQPRQVVGDAAQQRVAIGRRGRQERSEEHTSELQSRENLVCRHLLEKKQTTQHGGNK